MMFLSVALVNQVRVSFRFFFFFFLLFFLLNFFYISFANWHTLPEYCLMYLKFYNFYSLLRWIKIYNDLESGSHRK
jgi:hypothetical protein